MVDRILTNQRQDWKAYPRFPEYGDYPMQAIEKALKNYRTNMISYSIYLVIPEDWEALPKKIDILSTILWESLKQYFDYLSHGSRLLRLETPFVSYADATKIDMLEFPEPQLIPDTHDPFEYYTNLSRVLLHIFSYPGLTACRCEMDAQRNTSWLLFTLFDWFGVIQLGSPKREVVDSIHVFNRSSKPQWTKYGLVPIVFFPQPLHPFGEHREFASALRNNRIEDNRVSETLMPLLVAIEPTLTLLLDRVIIDWREKRKTSDERFALPEWLFIHGLVYDALQIDIYTFVPTILECDDNGAPTKWEFICIPMPPFIFNLFDNRNVLKRASNAAVLLMIQRHTKRICRALDNLDQSAISQVNMQWDIPKDLKYAEQDQYADVKMRDTIVSEQNHAETASQCLSDCIRRAGLNPLPQHCSWTFESFSYVQNLGSQKDFLLNFVENWQSQSKIPLPEDWLTATWVPTKRQPILDPWDLFQILPKQILQIWISQRKESFVPLGKEELRTRHLDSQSFCPDFYLSTPARKERLNVYDKIPLQNLCPDTVHCLEHFKDVFQYLSHELEAKMAISSPFMCTPCCWLKYDTQSRFPTTLSTDHSPVDFSLLLHPVQTVPIEMTPLTLDVNLRATILNPALVVAIQGPAAWPDELACPPSSHPRPKNKSEALRDLAKAIEPSLKTHLINWQLRFEQGLVSTKNLPEWFMLFGIIYDAEEVNIVAHVPFMNENSQYSFISCIVDTIPFPPVDGSFKVTDSWFLDRFRVGLALLSLQKHAFHMAGLWECVIWPDELVSWEEILEREYLGPVLTPSERGYMVGVHPMTELYLNMHGSDETLDEYDDSISEDGEDNENGEGSENGEDSENEEKIYDGYEADNKENSDQDEWNNDKDDEQSSDDDDHVIVDPVVIIEKVKRIDYLHNWLQGLQDFTLVDAPSNEPDV